MVNRILITLFIALLCSSAQASLIGVNRSSSTAYPLLRLKLVKDAFNYDDIAIGFNASATTTYNNQLDSKYLPGIDAAEGLSSLSSDDVALSINIVPLPKQGPLVIRLDVEAANSGAFTLQRTELDSIPALYDFWLIDNFAKDSLNLRTGDSYAFNIDKNNSATFGSSRFRVVIRQNPALGIHLLSFDAAKAVLGAELTWTTQNEENNTNFAVERSIDDGANFLALDSIASNGSGAYNYADKYPVNGTDMYRLKITDINGALSYSNIESLSFGSTVAEANSINIINIYPNPSNGIINLAINQKSGGNPSSGFQQQQTSGLTQSLAALPSGSTVSYSIKIVNINGSVVKEASSSSANWQTNVASLLPGTYIIQVINNNNKSLVGKSTFIKL